MSFKIAADDAGSTGGSRSSDGSASGPRPAADPLILTARFDTASGATFQRLRDQHFPPKLNIVPAHCTLFHHLPGEALDAIGETLHALCGAETPHPFATQGLRFLGRGVAVEIGCAGLRALRARLATIWTATLTAQDRQGFKPHVTIQNKVDGATARALRDRLLGTWLAVEGRIEGLDLWHYRGGPWEPAFRFTFGA